MEPQSPSKSKLSIMGFVQSHRIAKFGLILVVVVLVSAGGYYGFSRMRMVKPYFTVVVDCGSTGTRVNVYEWRVKEGGKDGDLPVLLHSHLDDSTTKRVGKKGCRYHCMQTEPGLDKFVGNSSGVRASLEPLIRWAEGLIPHHLRRETAIFVLATAGLRRIPTEDAKRVLADVEYVVMEHSFMWRRDWIRVLSGKEEAYYGWVALNYRMGYLNDNNVSETSTLGLLDLGGSSLQVVIETDKAREDSHYMASKIGPIEHQLIAYSLPAFGLNKAFDRTVAMLIKLSSMENEGIKDVKHPCLSSRFDGNYSCSSCPRPDSPLHLAGDPDLEKCKLLARAAAVNVSISDWSEPIFDSSCHTNSLSHGNPLDIAINANPSGQYHALSGFFAVYNMLNLTSKANFTKIWERAQHLCSSTWDGTSYSGSQYCFKVLYLVSLLEDGLCLGKADITFGPGDISWTLGASMNEGQQVWKTARETRTLVTTPQYMEVISSPIFIFFTLAVLLFIVYYSQVKLPMTRKRAVLGTTLPPYSNTKHRPH